MMTKKFLSMFLALVMCLSLATTAFATTPPDDESEYDEIVVFSEPVQENGIQAMSALSSEDRIQQAKDGVLALGLEEMGFGYIEDACLAELDAYAEDENVILEEYRVLIPKARASSPVFIKTCRGYDFYCAFTSATSTLVNKKDFAKSSLLINWSQALANLAMCFGPSDVALTVPWTLLTSLSSLMPSDYEVSSGDKLDCYARTYPTNRAFYIKEGSSYVLIFNRQFGNVNPYNVYHHTYAIDGNFTEEIHFDTVKYPDITSDKFDIWLELLSGYYEEGTYPTSLTIASLIDFKWLINK